MSENNFPELKNLLGLPLTKATRLDKVQFFHFGTARITNAYGLILDVGAWTLEVACFWQLKEADQVTIDYQDAGIARDSSSFADVGFDLQLPGNTLRDRKLHDLVRSQPNGLNVWQVSAAPDGSLQLFLDGKRQLEIKPDHGILPNTQLFWRLFSNPSASWLGFGPDGVARG